MSDWYEDKQIRQTNYKMILEKEIVRKSILVCIFENYLLIFNITEFDLYIDIGLIEYMSCATAI